MYAVSVPPAATRRHTHPSSSSHDAAAATTLGGRRTARRSPRGRTPSPPLWSVATVPRRGVRCGGVRDGDAGGAGGAAARRWGEGASPAARAATVRCAEARLPRASLSAPERVCPRPDVPARPPPPPSPPLPAIHPPTLARRTHRGRGVARCVQYVAAVRGGAGRHRGEAGHSWAGPAAPPPPAVGRQSEGAAGAFWAQTRGRAPPEGRGSHGPWGLWQGQVNELANPLEGGSLSCTFCRTTSSHSVGRPLHTHSMTASRRTRCYGVITYVA